MKTLIVYDVEGWAFHHWAKGIAKYSPDGHSVDIMNNEKYGSVYLSLKRKYNATLLMSWNQSQTKRISPVMATLVASPGICYPYPPKDKNDVPSLIATEIRCSQNAGNVLQKFDSVLCTTNEIQETAVKINSGSKRVVIGVDTETYRPIMQNRKSEKITIGWCGQPNPTKGYAEALSVCFALSRDSNRYRFHFNESSFENCYTQEEMVTYYNTLDLFLTTGCAEGGPSPPLEAMACGVPMVGTESGFLGEIVCDSPECGFLTEPYTTKQEANERMETIQSVIENLDDKSIAEMQQAARTKALEYCWSIRSSEWLNAIYGRTA